MEDETGAKNRTGNTLRLSVLTTSFPTYPGSPSGIFVARMLGRLPESVHIDVVAPAGRRAENNTHGRCRIHTFRYAPHSMQSLAHEPGGIPVALRNKRWRIVLVPFFIFAMFVKFFRVAKDADVLYTNWTICGLVGGFVGRILRKPVVLTVRGEDVNRINESNIHYWMVKFAIDSCHSTVTVSAAIRDKLCRSFPSRKRHIQLIPNGIDASFFTAGERRTRRQRSTETIQLVTVGSLIPRKNVACIIKAVARIVPECDVILTVVGDGKERMTLQQQVRDLDLSRRVSFLGTVAPDALAATLSEADIFVLASSSEGRPNALLEAMAAALPVVVSDIPGNRELVVGSGCGLMFATHSDNELAQRIREMVTDRTTMSRFAQQGHDYIARNELTWDHTAEKYFAAFHTAMAED